MASKPVRYHGGMKLIRFLKGELAADARGWVSDGLIGEDQARAILARYGASYDDAVKGWRGYLVLLSLAAVMAGVGLILLLSHNWEEIPSWLKLGGILVLLGLINLQGLRLWHGTAPPSSWWRRSTTWASTTPKA